MATLRLLLTLISWLCLVTCKKMNPFFHNSNRNTVYLIVFAGESNSGGYALNSDATGGELGARNSIKIWDNIGNASWQTLNIGVNNLLGHAGFNSTDQTTRHGWELGLANTTDTGGIKPYPIYLVKTGQGGSTISQWSIGDASGYMATFTSRVNNAKASLDALGIKYKIRVFYSQGINDRIAGTTNATWKSATITHLSDMRAVLGAGTPIIMTKMMTNNGNDVYNADIASICSTVSNTSFVDPGSATVQGDGNHWTYAGMKSISTSLINTVLTTYP